MTERQKLPLLAYNEEEQIPGPYNLHWFEVIDGKGAPEAEHEKEVALDKVLVWYILRPVHD